MVAITGQVSRSVIGRDAFQEMDITGITIPITKHNYLVTNVGELARTVREAFHIAQTGRPGPVLIDIPRDVQQDQTNFAYPDKIDLPGYRVISRGHPAQIKKAAKLINEAEQPVVIAGRGIVISQAYDEFREFAEKAQLPVTHTLLGLGSFPGDHILDLGMMGMHGTPCANMAVQNADLVVAVGMRFDDRATANTEEFAPNARVIHIDIDAAEIGKNIRTEVPVVGDAKSVLTALNEEIEKRQHVVWLSQIEQWRCEYPSLEVRQSDEVLPQYIIDQVREATRGDALMITGVGQNQMWAARYFLYTKPDSLISAGGLGPMGFELPAAMGAKIGRPEEVVWCIAGDGGFQMTIQELATIAEENVAVKIAIMNNGYLGMVRQWQELFYGRRYVGTKLWNPDFVKIAEAYGIPGVRVERREEIASTIQQAMESPGAFLIDFLIEPEENIYPIVPPGESLARFFQPSKPEMLEGKL
jgi:acetolactate synthase-1/2/3 large subunit